VQFSQPNPATSQSDPGDPFTRAASADGDDANAASPSLAAGFTPSTREHVQPDFLGAEPTV
jgi:hypothetical protein